MSRMQRARHRVKTGEQAVSGKGEAGICPAEGKRSFTNYRHAERAKHQLIRTARGASDRAPEGFRLNIYPCAHCGHFHVGLGYPRG